MNYVNVTNSKISESSASIGSIGTESYSEKSNMTQGGGFLSWLTKTSDETKMALNAFQDGRPDVAIYLILKYKCDLLSVDSLGKTLFHHLIEYSKDLPMAGYCLNKLLSDKSLSLPLNIQDENGNTPAHYAAILNNNKLIEFLKSKGADLKIKNKAGYYIAEDNEDSNAILENNSDMILEHKSDTLFLKIDKKSSDNSEEMMLTEIAKIVNNFRSDTENSNISLSNLNTLSEKDTENKNNMSDNVLTDDFIKNIMTIFKQNKQYDTDGNIFNVNLDKTINDLELIDKILDNNDNNDNNNNIDDNTDTILKSLLNKSNNKNSVISNPVNNLILKGGDNIKGNRKMITYSDQLGGSSKNKYTKSINSDESGISEMARAIKKQSTEIHDRVITKIMEILKVDEITARAYKGALYAKVKDEHPELSNFDRAIEMEKLATDKVLNKLNDKKINEIKNHIKDKSVKNNSSDNSNDNSSDIISKKNKKDNKNKEKILNTTESSLSSLSSIEF
jgi:hypothetical protein